MNDPYGYRDLDGPVTPSVTTSLSTLIFSFEGRINTLQFLLGIVVASVLNISGAIALGLFLAVVSGHSGGTAATIVLLVAVPAAIVSGWQSLALLAKRGHDIGFSGWAVLFTFIPYLGGLVSLGFLFWPGESRANAYGPLPTGIHPSHPYQLATWDDRD